MPDPTEPQRRTALAEPQRRATLAAAASQHAAASGAGELHHRDLEPVAALELTFADLGGQQLSPEEIRERVRVRFPAVPALPQRPALDALVAAAGLELTFDEVKRVYRATRPGPSTEGLESRRPTSLGLASSPVGSTGALGARLEQSIASRSFLALGVRADRLPRLVDAARNGYGATVVDVTAVLLEALRAASAAAGLPWELVRAADAESESSRERRGLNELVRRSWPQVEAAVEQALARDGTADGGTDDGSEDGGGGPGAAHRGVAAGPLRQHGPAGPVDGSGRAAWPRGVAARAAVRRQPGAGAGRASGAVGRAEPVRGAGHRLGGQLPPPPVRVRARQHEKGL